MTITTPQGFTASGISAGIKANGNPDLAVVRNTGRTSPLPRCSPATVSKPPR